MKPLRLAALLLVSILMTICVDKQLEVKVLYWNIQNGMWSDQGNNYDDFVEFVKSEAPDVCVWAEAESRYRTDTADKMAVISGAHLLLFILFRGYADLVLFPRLGDGRSSRHIYGCGKAPHTPKAGNCAKTSVVL
jgi:hypothetical protein